MIDWKWVNNGNRVSLPISNWKPVFNCFKQQNQEIKNYSKLMNGLET
jgi:hypothetical protein